MATGMLTLSVLPTILLSVIEAQERELKQEATRKLTAQERHAVRKGKEESTAETNY
jgi:nitrate reductase cytochrome c-type subunit